MDQDPEDLDLICLEMLRYSEAFHAAQTIENIDKNKAWKGSKMLARVKANEASDYYADVTWTPDKEEDAENGA